MIKKIITTTFSFVVIAIAFYSCDTTEPDNGKINPPGYQEDIPWPSLADSPWPMAGHDPQATGRSPYVGPKNGSIIWEDDNYYSIYSGLAIAEDSSLFFTTGGSSGAGLIKMSPNGDLQWKKKLGTHKNYTVPLILKNGDIICFDSYEGIYRINPDSNIVWKFFANSVIAQTTVNVGLDGTIYFVDNAKTLYAINSNGNLLWTLSDDRFRQNLIFQTTFSPDGNTLYVPGKEATIIAVDVSQKSIKWVFGNIGSTTNLMVDFYSNVYALTTEALLAVNQSGELLWEFKHNEKESFINVSPCIDYNGNIFFAADTLYSIDFNGNTRWKKDLGGRATGFLVCDKVGNVFIAVKSSAGIEILCYSTKGNELWNISNLDEIYGQSPSLGSNGILYYPLYDKKIIAIK